MCRLWSKWSISTNVGIQTKIPINAWTLRVPPLFSFLLSIMRSWTSLHCKNWGGNIPFWGGKFTLCTLTTMVVWGKVERTLLLVLSNHWNKQSAQCRRSQPHIVLVQDSLKPACDHKFKPCGQLVLLFLLISGRRELWMTFWLGVWVSNRHKTLLRMLGHVKRLSCLQIATRQQIRTIRGTLYY